MYPYTRGSGRPTAAISPPQSISPRSTSQRDTASDRGSDFESLTLSDRPLSEAIGYRASSAAAESAAAAAQKDTERLNTIAQKFFTKAALTIISSRLDLPHTFKRGTNQIMVNKWFNLILDHSDMVLEDVYDWAIFDMIADTPRPLIIEIYLDVSELGRTQTLVIQDERGEKWDICKALGTSRSSGSSTGKPTQIVLERWKLQIKPQGLSGDAEPSSAVYKKALVMFRTMYFLCRLLPAWTLRRKIAKEPATLISIRPSYRVVSEGQGVTSDLLTTSLYPSVEPTTVKQVLAPVHSPIGDFCTEVTYRSNCTIQVVNTDSLMSSRFRVMDDQQFRPSLEERSKTDYAGGKAAGSLPSKWRGQSARPELHTYGSLATYHNAEAPRASPVSVLRAVGAPSSSPLAGSTPPGREPPDHRASISSKSSLKTAADGSHMINRRLSVTFQPFKAGTLASSPLIAGTSAGTSDLSKGLQEARSRTSLSALPQAALRIPAGASAEVAVGSLSPSSPKPPTFTRYSSSFGNRKSRLSSGGSAGRNEELTGSSLRGSQSSSKSRSSGALAEQGGSSGSLQTDDDQIADFLKLLDQKKDLQSFNRTDTASREASTRRTTAALSKYRGLRDSHVALSESLGLSSSMLHRSSSSSSRVPALVAGSSLSSASPGKPMSPHTPHTPAIPSRLSSAAIAEDFEGSDHSDHPHREPALDLAVDDIAPNFPSSRPIDVPNSPQQRIRARRSSSTAYRRHVMEGLDEYGLRSASVPLREQVGMKREPLKSTLSPAEGDITAGLLPSSSPRDPVNIPIPASLSSRTSSGIARYDNQPSTSGSRPSVQARSHLSRGGAGLSRGSPRVPSPDLASASGALGHASRYAYSSRSSVAAAAMDDDEPLLFTMSELEAQARRSSVEDVATLLDNEGSGVRRW